ncbi:MAG: hypothetical protein Q8Q39_03105 [bacterium]|nr:hypothetical protein [bacterium]
MTLAYHINSAAITIDAEPHTHDQLLRDAADDDVAIMRQYFDRGYEIFSARLAELKDLRQTLTDQEERELRFMLEALISAKRSLE